jgi:photosystem II stability/assembly factor-like uncharacterized protein
VKKLFCMLIVAMTPVLSGCLENGSSAPPPPWLPPTPGDGRVKLEWTPTPGVNYWLFTATDPSLSAFHWTGLPNAYAHPSAVTPFYMCGLFSGMTYYFATNGRVNGGPGGPSSPTISATPYNASAATWMPISTPSSPNLYGVGYTSLTTCSNNAMSATGSFASVGAAGAIFTSADGNIWTPPNPANVPSGLPDLYAVTGYAANQNNPGNPAGRWVAVGAGGASVYSTDGGTTWIAGNASGVTTQTLRSITHVVGTFVAVGDVGTILTTTDGITWTTHSSGLTTNPLPNLNGVTHGAYYVAVGDSGTILTSVDANTWYLHAVTPTISSNLRQVASIGNLIVAVGDGGTIVTSKDGGATWYTQNLPALPNLVGVAAESQLVANDVVDGWLGVVPSVQFVAVDGSGNAYTTKSSITSVNGLTWTGPSPTNSASLNALVSSGFGYIAVGNAGATTHAF